ncbi:MAG: ferredoxin--NADP reductase [Cellvibrionales bacterium]|nr:ferredoxin--NADP reductase [Cellvibrionales bacterium]
MASIITEQVLSVHHWNDNLFSFKTTRQQAFTFENGHFVMMGLEVDGKPLMRAYSIASPNYADHLEFFSIKVPNGPLTSRLKNLKAGDTILLSTKPTGTLVPGHLLPGKHLYLLSTGTGLAPFLSIIQDPHIYERFDKIILTHGVRQVEDLTYERFIQEELPQNEYFGELVKEKLIYFPTVTRESFKNNGRLTDLVRTGKLFEKIGLPTPKLTDDRFMLCGSTGMLKDFSEMFTSQGFEESRQGKQAHFVIERAFVEK